MPYTAEAEATEVGIGSWHRHTRHGPARRRVAPAGGREQGRSSPRSGESLRDAVDRCLDDDAASDRQDRARHPRRRPLDERRGDRRGAGGDVSAVAVEVELCLIADGRARRRGGGVAARNRARPIAADGEAVAVDRDLRTIGPLLALSLMAAQSPLNPAPMTATDRDMRGTFVRASRRGQVAGAFADHRDPARGRAWIVDVSAIGRIKTSSNGPWC